MTVIFKTMTKNSSKGDGIGPEIMDATLEIILAAGAAN
jgi:isocitrate/isopropylmalate dehydrogenase